MSYHIELTESEESELRVMYRKGYDCGLLNAIVHKAHIVREEGGVSTYALPEHVVWELSEEWNEILDGGNDPFGPFVAATIRAKFGQLMSEVV